MSRKTWIVLCIVVAVLGLSPYLPVAWNAVRTADLAAMSRDVASGAAQLLAFAQERPDIIAGAAATVFLLMLIGVALRWRRAEAEAEFTPVARQPVSDDVLAEAVAAAPFARSLAAAVAAGQSSAAPIRMPAPTAPVAPPVPARASAPALVPAVATSAPRPNRGVAGRGHAVRRLSAEGHSAAEIARATRVGQDAVRLVLSRVGASSWE